MDKDRRISQYLEPLLDGTPLAVERLREAWPGLAMSDRAYLIFVLLEERRGGPHALQLKHHKDSVIDLALADESSYIRYLAARHVRTPEKHAEAYEVERFERIRKDPVALVRYAQEEQVNHGLMSLFGTRDLAQFWRQPQAARLTSVSNERVSDIAELFRFATKELLPVGSVTVYEMADVLLQYIGPRFANEFAGKVTDASHSYDGSLMYGLAQDSQTLWELIPDVPKELSYLLLDRLPEPPYSAIPNEVVESLDAHQLECLLSRNDIKAGELRRKTYTESKNEGLRGAAVSSQSFELQDADVSSLVFDLEESEESAKEKFEDLRLLANYCQGATLVQMQAIFELIFHAPNSIQG